MNREQKIAWSFVITIPLGVILGIVAYVSHHFALGSPKPFIFAAVGVIAVGPFLTFFVIKKDKGKVTFDERDKLIERNAHLAGFVAVYLYVIILSFLPIIIFGLEGFIQIPSKWSPGLLMGAGLCLVLGQSIAILIQYGRGGKDGQK